MTESYNGWANRETWLVNLHFGDGVLEMLQDEVDAGDITTESSYRDIADYVEDFVDTIVAEEMDEVVQVSSFISDFIDFGRIDYYSLAKSYEGDLDYPEEEEEEEEE